MIPIGFHHHVSHSVESSLKSLTRRFFSWRGRFAPPVADTVELSHHEDEMFTEEELLALKETSKLFAPKEEKSGSWLNFISKKPREEQKVSSEAEPKSHSFASGEHSVEEGEESLSRSHSEPSKSKGSEKPAHKSEIDDHGTKAFHFEERLKREELNPELAKFSPNEKAFAARINLLKHCLKEEKAALKRYIDDIKKRESKQEIELKSWEKDLPTFFDDFGKELEQFLIEFQKGSSLDTLLSQANLLFKSRGDQLSEIADMSNQLESFRKRFSANQPQTI
jgi:hypothetical protein